MEMVTVTYRKQACGSEVGIWRSYRSVLPPTLIISEAVSNTYYVSGTFLRTWHAFSHLFSTKSYGVDTVLSAFHRGQGWESESWEYGWRQHRLSEWQSGDTKPGSGFWWLPVLSTDSPGGWRKTPKPSQQLCHQCWVCLRPLRPRGALNKLPAPCTGFPWASSSQRTFPESKALPIDVYVPSSHCEMTGSLSSQKFPPRARRGYPRGQGTVNPDFFQVIQNWNR